MNISSAQTDYLTISNDDIITIDTSTYTSLSSPYTVTLSNTTANNSYTTGILSGNSIGTITIDDLNSYQHQWVFSAEEFINCFPDWERVQNMCKEYPGLKIAFEKFVTTYKLVKDDYDTPKDKRAKP